MQQARPIRADAGRSPRRRASVGPTPSTARASLDGRRLASTILSLVIPGAGQLLNGRPRLALTFFLPSALLVISAWVALQVVGTARLAAWAIVPERLDLLLTLNVVLAIWRLAAAGQAFFDPRYPAIPGRAGVIGGLVAAAVLVAPHAYASQVGESAGDAMARMFRGGVVGANTAEGGEPGATLPATGATALPRERINILLVGIDRTEKRNTSLTDTMIVASLDPVGKTISMVSVPRDTIHVPLGNGNDFGPKINSLYGYAERHTLDFPKGPERTLQDALGALLGIPIHYYAKIDFKGFIDIIDAVGGVDITVKRSFDDPKYDGYGRDGRGFAVEKGRQHFDGAEALAYARVRKAVGETDFTRAERQQQILVALKNKLTRDGSVFWALPQLLDAIGETVETDVPIDRLPDVALVIDEMERDAVTRVVIKRPLVKPANTAYGAAQIPRLKAIRAMAAGVFSEPGTAPVPWPTPEPTAPPREEPSARP